MNKVLTIEDVAEYRHALELYRRVFGGNPSWWTEGSHLENPAKMQKRTGEMLEVIGLAYAHWASRGREPLTDEVDE